MLHGGPESYDRPYVLSCK